jgi:hypothetical protein
VKVFTCASLYWKFKAGEDGIPSPLDEIYVNFLLVLYCEQQWQEVAPEDEGHFDYGFLPSTLVHSSIS